MAISLIGTPQTGVANNGGAVTLTWSTTPIAGDYTIAIVSAPATSSADVSVSGPYAYTRLAYFTGSSSNHPAIGIFYKKQGASPDTNVVCQGNNGTATDSTAIGYVLRGVDPDTPSDNTPTSAGPTTSTNPAPASIGINTSGAWALVAACSIQTIDTAVTVPSGYENGYRVGGDDSTDNTTAAATKLCASGTESPSSWTDWTAGSWVALTVAFRPAGEPVDMLFNSHGGFFTASYQV